MTTDKVLYASDEAAQLVTVTGWRSRTGRFYGSDEHLARWDGCTHQICECGAEMPRGFTKCNTCIEKDRLAKYEAMPFQEWDGTTPLTFFDDDDYFFDQEEVEQYCEDNDLQLSDLRLVICVPQFAEELDPNEYLADILPQELYLSDIDPKLEEAFETLNKVIRERKKPISWTMGKFRTTLQSPSSTVEHPADEEGRI